jgi:hypothetical protein
MGGRGVGDERSTCRFPSRDSDGTVLLNTANQLSALRFSRVMIAKPLLDFFPLSGKDNALPLHHAGALTVFGHYIRTLIEYLNQAIRLGPFEVVRRQRGMVLLHTTLE